MYSKPLVLMNEDIAEGVFAASGSEEPKSQDICFYRYGYCSWGTEAQQGYYVYVPENSDTNLKFKAKFSKAVKNVWGMNGEWKISSDGKSATCKTYTCSGQTSLYFISANDCVLTSLTRTK